MNINNFRDEIDDVIVNRGYNYYISKNISKVYNNGGDEYTFEIEGSELYEVTVSVDARGEILTSYCDCPYDFGPICKHEVAAYFYLADIFNNKFSIESSKKNLIKLPKIREILDELPKEKLIEIILDITEKDRSLRNKLIFKYSNSNDGKEFEMCKNLMDSIVKKYIRREGYISYRKTYDFVLEMEELLEKVSNTEDSLLAVEIAIMLLNEAIEAFEYADDSDGNIGQLADQAIDAILEISANSGQLDINVRKNLFNKLIKECDNEVFDGWDEYRINILNICREFCDIEEIREKLIHKIEGLIKQYSKVEYGQYEVERLLEILFRIIKKYGTKEEEKQFVKDNLKFEYFRELLIDKFIKKNEYHKVIKLTLDGEKQDKDRAGLLFKWQKIRYDAYKILSMKEEQEKLAKELLLKGNFEFYKDLKELNKEDEKVFYNSLKKELKDKKGFNIKSVYLKLILKENDLDAIMDYVRENTEAIEEFAGILVNKFKDEVIKIYEEHIDELSLFSTNRKQYQDICRRIKKYKKIAGKKNGEKIINKFMISYKKRPAFVDELSKIK